MNLATNVTMLALEWRFLHAYMCSLYKGKLPLEWATWEDQCAHYAPYIFFQRSLHDFVVSQRKKSLHDFVHVGTCLLSLFSC